MDSSSRVLVLMLILVFLTSSTICSITVKAESTLASGPPTVEWQKVYGNSDQIPRIIQTKDGGYAFVGEGWSHQLGSEPTRLYKLDSSGYVQWSKDMGVFDLVQTSDGGLAVAGVQANENALFKFDSNGNTQLTQTYQNGGGEFLVATGDGGFALAENTVGVGINFGGVDIIQSSLSLTKTDSNGKAQWTKTYMVNGHNGIVAFDIVALIQTSDGGYALAGDAYMNSNDTNFGLVKIGAQGNLQWIKTYGEAKSDDPSSLIQTSDGGFVLAGKTYSFNGAGDIEPNSTYFSYANKITGPSQAWLVKTDSSGNMVWNHVYAENSTSDSSVAHMVGTEVEDIVQTSDGGLAFGGTLAGTKMWLVKTDIQGSMQWQQTFVYTFSDGTPYESNGATSLIEASDGSFLIAGYCGTMPDPWNSQYLLVKTAPALPPPTPSPTLLLTPTPTPTPLTTPLITPTVETAILASLIIGVVVVAGLLVYHKKHKR